MTIAPVAQVRARDVQPRAGVRGLHPGDRLLVAARDRTRSTRARCSEVVWEEREGGEVYEISTGRRARALGDGARLGAAEPASRSPGTSTPTHAAATEVEVRFTRRGRRHARRPRAPRAGSGSARRGAATRERYGTRERLGDGASGRYAATVSSTASRPRPQTPTSTGVARRAVAQERADELGEAARGEGLVGLRRARRRPPAELEDVLGVQLLPGEARLRRRTPACARGGTARAARPTGRR